MSVRPTPLWGSHGLSLRVELGWTEVPRPKPLPPLSGLYSGRSCGSVYELLTASTSSIIQSSWQPFAGSGQTFPFL